MWKYKAKAPVESFDLVFLHLGEKKDVSQTGTRPK